MPQDKKRPIQGHAAQASLWSDHDQPITTECDLVVAALSLLEGCGGKLSCEDIRLWREAGKPKLPADPTLSHLAAAVARGEDPLGDLFCSIRSPDIRREAGATYTPTDIIQAMLKWTSLQPAPERVVDPGCGSSRFLLAASKVFPEVELIGIEKDPLAALISRANLAAAGIGTRARILCGDFRDFDEPIHGRTLYIGNPPYVRHHRIDSKWKQWLFDEANKLGHSVSKLAGLHVYFFLATAARARPGDIGIYITAAEWLDVNYGSLVRKLLLNNLGGKSITVIEPTAQPFPDAATTAAITSFEIGRQPQTFSFRRVSKVTDLHDLPEGRFVSRDRLITSSRWSHLTRTPQKAPEGFVELGELCRVHRGQVTGANFIWIAGEHSAGLPDSVLFPTITRAREVIAAAGVLHDSSKLRCVIDLPSNLDELDSSERQAVNTFLKVAKRMGATSGYVANHRKAWWAVNLRSPAPIVSTYMARRAPAFILNKADARHINVAHGLYPRISMTEISKAALVTFLQRNVSQASGRTYAGGLTKFEPREMERLMVPGPELLDRGPNL